MDKLGWEQFAFARLPLCMHQARIVGIEMDDEAGLSAAE